MKTTLTSSQRLLLILLLPLALLTGCTYQNEEELFPTPEQPEPEGATYSLTVVPILQANCYACHSLDYNQGNVVLEGYANVKKYATNGVLYGVISHAPGFKPMPKGGPKLADADIAKIKEWIDAGALDN